jgi:hypothetical protein
MSKAHMHALYSGHSGWLFAGASDPFSSLPFLLFLFVSLLSSSASPFSSQKPILGSARQESSHKGGMEGTYGQFAGCGRV